LGGFRLASDERVLEVKARKSKALLAWLALNPTEATPRDRLAGLLWEDRNTTQARQNLRQTLADIRRVLGDEQTFLEANADSVRLNPAFLDCDAVAFRDALDAGDRPGAAALFGGRLLDGYALRAPAFEQWLTMEQEHFDRLATDNLQVLMSDAATEGDHEHALQHARALLRIDHLREDAHREAMRALANMGRANDAIKQYNSCKSMLSHELGMPPDEQTHSLYQEVLLSRRNAPAASVAPPQTQDTASARVPELRHATVLAIACRELGQLMESGDVEQITGALDDARAVISRLSDTTPCITLRSDDELTVVVFGIDDGYGDHITQAIRTAQAMQQALENSVLNFAFAVCTGHLMCRPAPDNANPQMSGNALNQAVELASKAETGDLIAPSNIINGLSNTISHQGLKEPTAPGVCCVVRLGAFDAQHRLPLAGRTVELGQINALLKACHDGGTGHAVLLRGMAGMGKSRLIDEILKPLEETDWIIAYAEVLETTAGEANMPHLTRALMAIEDGHDAQWLLDQGLAERGLGAQDYPVMCKLLGLDPDADPSRREIQATLRRIMANTMTDDRPLITIIEDVHWADPATLSLVADLIAIASDYPALILMSTRVENEPLDPKWRAAFADTPLFTIDLGPLREADARAHCWAVAEFEPSVRRTPRVESIVERCISRAQGHPFFLEQSMRALLFTNDEMPLSVQSVVDARLKQLPESERNGVLAAAVLGTSFPHQALRDIHGEVDIALLHHHRLLRAHGDELQFDHDLLREGAYRTLLSSRRRELHNKAAEWYRERNPLTWVRHLIGAEHDSAPESCLEVAASALDANRPDQATEILSLLAEVDVSHEVKREVLKLSNRLPVPE
jgi:DNA-binding SARP family transcriptional activator